jgi:hypothetical protein
MPDQAVVGVRFHRMAGIHQGITQNPAPTGCAVRASTAICGCRARIRSVEGTPSARTHTFSINGVLSTSSGCYWQSGRGPRRFEVPPAIVDIVQHDVSLGPIQEGWDDLLRVAATIDEAWRSVTDVLERFGSAARGDRIYRAGHALSQLLRAAYQRTAPRYSIDALRRIGPVGHRHINFRGTYRFLVEPFVPVTHRLFFVSDTFITVLFSRLSCVYLRGTSEI